MKYLSDYMQDKQTELFDKVGAYFAFNKDQFEKGRKDGVKYVSVGTGMLCPEENVQELLNSMNKIYSVAIKQDIEENGIDKIIQRELGNYETQISGNWSEVYEMLTDYEGITREKVSEGYKLYYDECVKNDWF